MDTRVPPPPEDVKYKPLKRLPFGKKSPQQVFTFAKPPPLPPKDFYPRKPAFWKMYGTPAYNNRQMFSFGGCVLFSVIGLVLFTYKYDKPNQIFKFFMGSSFPTLDEVEARLMARQAKLSAMEGLDLPSEIGKTVAQVRQENALHGNLSDFGSGLTPKGTGSEMMNIDSLGGRFT